jgi:hypothetical protein
MDSSSIACICLTVNFSRFEMGCKVFINGMGTMIPQKTIIHLQVCLMERRYTQRNRR